MSLEAGQNFVLHLVMHVKPDLFEAAAAGIQMTCNHAGADTR
jgi:hypothetical protein